VRAALAHPADTDALVRSVADGLGLRLTTATAFFLARATVLAALSLLERAGEVKVAVEENRLLWHLS